MLENTKSNRFVIEADLIADLVENYFPIKENKEMRKNFSSFNKSISTSRGGYILNKGLIDELSDIVLKKHNNNSLSSHEDEIYKDIVNSDLFDFLLDYKLSNSWAKVDSIVEDDRIYTESKNTDWFGAFSKYKNELLEKICSSNFNYYADKSKILNDYDNFSNNSEYPSNRKIDPEIFFEDFLLPSTSIIISDPYLVNIKEGKSISFPQTYVNISRILTFYYRWIENMINQQDDPNFIPEIVVISRMGQKLTSHQLKSFLLKKWGGYDNVFQGKAKENVVTLKGCLKKPNSYFGLTMNMMI